jgi:hypothetical protein
VSFVLSVFYSCLVPRVQTWARINYLYFFVIEFSMYDIRVFFMQIEISDVFFFVFEVFKVIFLLR